MDLLRAALKHDPSAPRLTVYVDSPDPRKSSRMEFSTITLDNWASKLGNYFLDEAMMEPGDSVAVAMPARWQTAAVILGAVRAGITLIDDETAADAETVGLVAFVESLLASSGAEGDSVEPSADADTRTGNPFLRYTDNVTAYSDAPVYLCTDDPFGRSVEDTGVDLDELNVEEPVDLFGEARLCPDAFMGDDSAADDPDHIVLRDHNGPLTVDELYEAGQRWYEAQIHDNDAVADDSDNPPQPHRALLGAWPSIRDFLIVAVGTWMNNGSLVIYSDETNRNDGRYRDIAATEKAAISGYPQ
ncbi:hypothetical protein I6J22_09420 [Corynebacterium kroppenstedtii]|uniref:TIGR03089 family protein n=1 Tax=Corynebacterium kroppenstedtii (strain DSM 44385 / JCM 11950 / CIP 105744 / CCUG 35717) TaxID=645127 RepID=C4LK96_CORK4|nr:TIGR03089 family protein [Corynebacterium kroppenstedtii]ACR18251.1 hypothetical protein ckrop_1522 [Corynebacterium kroppenstedtii DSM 44385]QRP10396.1 hypothetical protein I6J22_09420 [Corynebacterium kroppenstedtii]